MKKKSQAALEFLMTYGWALLVVLVMIGVFAYFIFRSPGALVPESCQVPPGFTCDEFVVEAAGPDLVLIPNLGERLDFTVTDCTASTDDAADGTATSCQLDGGSGDVTVASGDTVRLTFSGMTLTPGDKKPISFTVEYTETGGQITKKLSGEVIGEVQ